MRDTLLIWIAAGGSVAGFFVGLFAYRWKRRNPAAWMIYGVITFGFAAVILAVLPRLERRTREYERQVNWHR